MKNLLLALTLLATIGSVSANDGKPGKKNKKAPKETTMQCSKDEKPGASCCARKPTAAAIVTTAVPEAAKK
ncbi:hypothetical protein FY528_15715 [Hymenobacter lutimineralis]|uniref:Uncharacterized protein n=1 Tax=Hymenobacter lutimineralis TaxID=2606448 RepID=A0A5D6UXD9_9BACT|nr:hypothetical protein [Hymenobacter lutimineralis]TYZ07262.1 hypothetical protein FY528_15715 [Hymenobacter lutimineralis]